MNIIIFGGSFDPPHLGHMAVAQSVLETEHADELWYVPCFKHPFDKNLTASEHRVAMLRLIATTRIRINTFEVDRGSVSYTVDTLRHFQHEFTEHTFSFVIGSDQVADFPKWKDYQDLLKNWKRIVYPREKYPLSSTQVRERIKAGKPITDLVAPDVERYIMEHKLYT